MSQHFTAINMDKYRRRGIACQTQQSAIWIKVQTCPPMAKGGIALEGWKPLTGTDVGISLRVYLDLLARGCRSSSFQTDWDEDSRLTRDRKDWRREKHLISESRGAKGARDFNRITGHSVTDCRWIDVYWAIWFQFTCGLDLLWCYTLNVVCTQYKYCRQRMIEELNVKRPAEHVGKAFTYTVCFCPSLLWEAASRLEDQAPLLDAISLTAIRSIQTHQKQ